MDNMLRISNAELSAIAHATESIEKVTFALKNVLPSDLRGKIIFKQEHTTGHHGNPIATLRATLTSQGDIRQLIAKIASRISSLDRTSLTDELDRFVDEEGTLYLRFDKQEAYLGDLHLKQKDAIRIRVKFHGNGRKLDAMRKTCKEMGLVN